MNEEQSVRFSDDGSHTLYSKKYKAHYHSVFGAIEESTHVFISAGLYHLFQRQKKDFTVFEMGFGTGLNALLTAVKSSELGISVQYETVESDPIDIEILANLNYSIQVQNCGALFDQIHEAPWSEKLQISQNFSLTKHQCKIEDHVLQGNYDLIYWDAFAPSCQSNLWEHEIHQKIYKQLKPYGILVSYCSNSKFRRVLEDIGYHVEFLNGPAKKREMIRAVKK